MTNAINPYDMEFPFTWTCPKCCHCQGDTVNPVLGPYVNLICGKCGDVSEEPCLDETSIASWEAARSEADKFDPTNDAAAA